ncbi:bacteriocin [Lampropedia puyangensis]|uniref:Bacteriocin n=1 Tax=Lampropedia puyangensis TaxID=1330072 RepID=A0A4S8EWG4_9BURK|nr:family 1 encapsulin nanocompartment shell protein [Lampropedia puyangensis]THT99239.1 bacteriocin [Lampropedia puyangensis]
MNNLHRELAPISDAAWKDIEEEVARTFKRSVAGRRVVDVRGPEGSQCASIGTGHQISIASPIKGVIAKQREVMPLVELRVPFELSREQIDDVQRGSEDSDWQPAKDAATQLAFAEDTAIFDGYAAAGITGIRNGSSNKSLQLSKDISLYPDAVAAALKQLRLEGVDGPYAVVLGSDAYTALSEGSDQGYPVISHLQKLINGEIFWSSAIEGGCIVSMRGGDYALHLGCDLSIGYTSHDQHKVQLYLKETLTFRMLTAEAAVPLKAPK